MPLARGVFAGDAAAEATLLKQLLADNRDGQRLYHLLFYNNLVYVCEGVTHDLHLAEDAASKVNEYMLLGGGLKRFVPGRGRTLAQWIYEAGRWRAGDVLAKRRRQAPEGERVLSEIAEEILVADRMAPPTGGEENEILSWIEQEAPIGEDEKRVLRLRFVDGMTLKETAKASGLSVSTVRRAQATLRDVISENAERFHMHWTGRAGGVT